MIEHAGKGGSQFAGYAKTLIEAYLRQSYPVAADTAQNHQSHAVSVPWEVACGL